MLIDVLAVCFDGRALSSAAPAALTQRSPASVTVTLALGRDVNASPQSTSTFGGRASAAFFFEKVSTRRSPSRSA